MIIFIALIVVVVSALWIISSIFNYYETRHDYTYSPDDWGPRNYRRLVYLSMAMIVASMVIVFCYFFLK